MDRKLAAKIVAVLAVGAAMTACVIALRPGRVEGVPAPAVRARSDESASSELIRCREMGAAALADPACRKAWAAGRRHFLGEDREGPRP